MHCGIHAATLTQIIYFSVPSCLESKQTEHGLERNHSSISKSICMVSASIKWFHKLQFPICTYSQEDKESLLNDKDGSPISLPHNLQVFKASLVMCLESGYDYKQLHSSESVTFLRKALKRAELCLCLDSSFCNQHTYCYHVLFVTIWF